MTRRIVIMGGGPAGLTAALELSRHPRLHITVVEAEKQVGGISRTVEYRGNRMDIGGHRFFSKSDRIMDWWRTMLPPQGAPSRDDILLHRSIPLSTDPRAPDPEKDDLVMLVRDRLSRIYYQRKFYPYPVSLNLATVRNLGLARMMKIGFSYLGVSLSPIRPEKNLEDFMINRFGRELYRTFFRDYTEKVWGIPCHNIAADWGAQRIKGLSIPGVLRHALSSLFKRGKPSSVDQKTVETSLIERFYYPKYGPGQLWEETARRAAQNGVTILLRHEVVDLEQPDQRITGVRVRDLSGGGEQVLPCDEVISSLAVKDLAAMLAKAPEDVRQIGAGLVYRDFISIGLLLKRLKIGDASRPVGTAIPDTWIYIQEPEVKLGRLQVFNNWSPYMVADPQSTWLGLEYFVNENDELWNMADADLVDMASRELAEIGVADRDSLLDGTTLRVKKAYPAYFGSYDRFPILEKYLKTLPNLYPVGRNGMHRYNNMDHSMLSAMAAAECIVGGTDKEAIWKVNSEQEYHESK